MARYTGPKCKLCRREGVKLYLKGAKCDTPKCPLTRKPAPPGEFGNYPRMSRYGLQLREKQKVKRVFGVTERQFKRLFNEAKKDKAQTGLKLLQSLELRLDNIVYRLGFAATRDQARQYVNHGHIKINGRKMDIPSHIVSVGDEVTIAEAVTKTDAYQQFKAEKKGYKTPRWLGVRPDGTGVVSELPTRDDIDPGIKEELILEFYSR